MVLNLKDSFDNMGLRKRFTKTKKKELKNENTCDWKCKH